MHYDLTISVPGKLDDAHRIISTMVDHHLVPPDRAKKAWEALQKAQMQLLKMAQETQARVGESDVVFTTAGGLVPGHNVTAEEIDRFSELIA